MQDWVYEMRREMQLVVKGLYLGPYSCAKSMDQLKANSITHIICIRDQSEAHLVKLHFQDAFQYHVLYFYLIRTLSDNPDSLLTPLLPNVVQLIDTVISQSGNVLVHCNSGISRSPSVCIAYLMFKFNFTCELAFSTVQRIRFCINPNECFKHQLTVRVSNAGLSLFAGRSANC